MRQGRDQSSRYLLSRKCAGKMLISFRRSLLLVVALILCLPTNNPAQQTATSQQEDALITALLQADREQALSLQQLLQNQSSLVTPRLWQKLISKAVTAYYTNSPDHSLALYRIALIVAKQLQDTHSLATTHYNICRTYSGMGRTQEAIQSCLISKDIFSAAGLARDLIYVLSDIGSLFLYARDYPQARAYSEQAIAMAHRVENTNQPAGALPDSYGVAGAASTLGALCNREGNYAQAIEYLQKSIELYKELDRTGLRYGYQQADNLSELARVYKATGENPRALLLLSQALTIAQRLPYHDLTARILQSIGLLYLEQEDYAQAVHYFEQSLAAYHKSPNQTEATLVWQNLGVTYQRQGNYAQALESFQKSLSQAGLTDKDVAITAQQGMGVVYREQGNFKAALEALAQGLALAKEIGDQTRIAEILWRKAEVYFDLHNYAEAAVLSEEALRIARSLRLPKLSYLTATTLGKAYIGQQKHALAANVLSQAIEQVETMRSQVVGREQGRQLFFEKKVTAYHALLELLIAQNKRVEALNCAEKAKARVLSDLLQGSRISFRKAMTPKEETEEQQLNQAILVLNNQIREERLSPAPDAARLAALTARLDTARLKYAAFHDLLYANHPEWALSVGQNFTLRSEDLNSLLIEPNSALLNYVVTKERSYLFLLSKRNLQQNVDVAVFPINITEEKLKRIVSQYRQMLASRHPDFAALARQLYDILIQPAATHLQGISTIGIIADSELWDLPFQALQPSAGHYLVEDYSLYFAPSLRVLKELQERKTQRSELPALLAFANPQIEVNAMKPSPEARTSDSLGSLPEAETEVQALSQFFPAKRSQIFIGANADEKTFKSQASAYRIIHCATHGILDDKNPLYSYLLFSSSGTSDEDGFLEAREILNLHLNADLVVLSACETARGRVSAGEGMIGMAWAFFAAGSRATLVSQWKVNSASTAEWMTSFYRTLQAKDGQGKETKADALRLTMRKMMKDRRFAHPFYWAGFVLIGSNE